MNKKFNYYDYANVLYYIVSNYNDNELNILLNEFVKIIIKDNKADKIDKILNLFKYIYNKKNNIVDVDIISAQKLSDDIINNIKIIFVNYYKEVNLNNIVDASIIGGVCIKYNNYVIDCSILNILKTFFNFLNK